MDPTTTINQMREAAAIIQAEFLQKGFLDAKHFFEAVDLAECFSALDSWLCKNGALPEQWKYKDK